VDPPSRGLLSITVLESDSPFFWCRLLSLCALFPFSIYPKRRDVLPPVEKIFLQSQIFFNFFANGFRSPTLHADVPAAEGPRRDVPPSLSHRNVPPFHSLFCRWMVPFLFSGVSLLFVFLLNFLRGTPRTCRDHGF